MPKISELTAIPSIDPSDLLVVVDITDGTTKKATVSQLPSSGGGSPGGSNTQLQFNNAGVFGGTGNLAYVSGKLRTTTNIQWQNALITGDLAWAPTTSNRTITLPDATGTVVLNDNTATLTGKIIAAGSNTITGIADANVAAGANIANSKVVVPGSAGQILMNVGGSAWGSTANFTYASGGLVGNGSSFISLAGSAGTPATSGDLRVGNVFKLVSRTTGGTDTAIVETNASNDAYFGNQSTVSAARLWGTTSSGLAAGGNTEYVVASAGSGVAIASGSAERVIVSSSDVKLGTPIAGNQNASVPLRRKSAAITQSSTTATALSAAQYECPVLLVTGTPGGAFNIIGPTTADAWFEVYNGTPSALTIKTSAGTGITIATTKTAQVRCDGTNYVRCTPDA